MKADRIDEIIDPEFRTGTTEKNGRKFTWRLVKVRVGDREATGFGPVVEGDPVQLSYDSQYHNYKFKVLEGNDLPTIDIDDDSGSDDARQSPIKEPSAPPKAAAVQDKYLKDISDYPMRVYTAGLPYIDFQHMMKTPKYLDDYLSYVERVSAHLLAQSDKARAGELRPATEAPAAPKKYQFKKDEVEEPNEGWVPSDEDYSG